MNLITHSQKKNCTLIYPRNQKQNQSFPANFNQNSDDKSYINNSVNHNIFKKAPKILLVEDTKIIQKVNLTFLNRLGCKTDLACDGFEAMKMFLNGYHLILLDIGLPSRNGVNKSGIDVAKEIRCYETKTGIKPHVIIALTALDDSIREECMAAGFDDFYLKPLSLTALGQC